MIIDDKHVVGVDELMIHPYWRWWLRLSSRRLPVDRSSLDPTPRHEYRILDHPSESRYHGNHSQATIKTSPARNKSFQHTRPSRTYHHCPIMNGAKQALQQKVALLMQIANLLDQRRRCGRGFRVFFQPFPAPSPGASSKAVKTCAGKTFPTVFEIWCDLPCPIKDVSFIYTFTYLYPKEHKEKWEWETQFERYI